MSTTSRMSAGLAFEPEKDLAMFAEQAAQGRHLAGVARLGHGWKFREGEPEDAIFDLAHERDPDSDFLFYFSEAGWEHVLSLGDAHVFKAAPGTPPVHSGAASRASPRAVRRLVRGRCAMSSPVSGAAGFHTPQGYVHL